MAWNKYFSVEVPLFLSVFSTILQSGILGNLKIYRTCYIILGYNESDCAQLGKETNPMTEELEKKVHPTINDMQIANDIVSAFGLVYCIYVGIWSDKFGRKPFLLLCLLGNAVTALIYTFFMIFDNVSPWWFLVTQIPHTFTGNITTLFILISAYIADVTTTTDRMFRMMIFQVIFAAGQSLGSFLIPTILYGTSYLFSYCFITILQMVALVYTFFCIPESLPVEKEVFKCKNMLSYINFSEIIRAPLKQRPNNGRAHILLNIAIILILGASVGEGTVTTLFLRAKLHWTLTNISMLDSVVSVATIFTTALGTYFLYQKLQIKEIPLAVFCFTSVIIANILRGVATDDYFIYAASAFTLFIFLGNLMIKTLLTFMVAPEEMGKIIALLDILLSLVGTVSNFIYPLLYQQTLDINPGTIFFLSMGFHICGTIPLLFLLNVNIPHHNQPTEDKNKLESIENGITHKNKEIEEVCTKL